MLKRRISLKRGNFPALASAKNIEGWINSTSKSYTLRLIGVTPRAVASLTVPGGQEFHFPHFFLKFLLIFLIFPQTLLIFFLILALRVGDSPTQKGPGYATGYATEDWSVRAVTISQETTCHYKGAVSTLAHKKTRWHHVHYRFLAILRELCHLFWLKSFLASTTDKWVFLTLKIMNRPFKGYLPNSP